LESQSSEITLRPSFDITVSDTNCVNDVNFGLVMSYLTDIIITGTRDVSWLCQ